MPQALAACLLQATCGLCRVLLTVTQLVGVCVMNACACFGMGTLAWQAYGSWQHACWVGSCLWHACACCCSVVLPDSVNMPVHAAGCCSVALVGKDSHISATKSRSVYARHCSHHTPVSLHMITPGDACPGWYSSCLCEGYERCSSVLCHLCV